MREMANSAGDADREMSIIMDSLEYKINRFKETGTGIWQNLLDRGTIGNIIDFGTSVLSILDEATDKLGLLGSVIAGGAIASLIKMIASGKLITNLAKISTFVKEIFATSTLGGFLSGGVGASIGYFLPAILTALAGAAAIAGIVVAGVNAYKKANPSLDSLKSDADAAKEDFDEMKSKAEDARDRLRELQKLKQNGSISQSEQKELENISKQNEYYEAQLELLERIAEYKQQKVVSKANEEAVNEFNAFMANSIQESDDYWDWSGYVGHFRNDSGLGGLQNAIEDYTSAKAELDHASAALRAYEIASYEDVNYDPEKDAARLEAYRENVEKKQAIVDQYSSTLEGFMDMLIGWRGQMTDDAAIASIDSLLDSITGALGLTEANESFESFSSNIKKLSADAQKALYAVTKGEKQLVDESGKLTKEGQEVVEWLKDTGLSAEDAAVYLARWASELSDTTITGPNVDTSTALADLTSLRDELEQTAKDIEAYNKAMEGGEKGDSAQTYKSAWEKAREDIKAGKNDTRAVHAAASLIFGEDQLAAWGYDSATITKQLKSNKALKAILGGEEDIGLNFGNYLKDNAKQYAGLVDVMKNGDGTFDLAIHDFEGLANAMGISEGFLYALVDGLDAFGSQRMMDDKDLADLHTQFDQMNGDVGQLIESLASQGLDGMEIISTLHQLDEAFGDINFGDEIYQQVADAMKKLREGKDDEENNVPVGVTVEGGVSAMEAALKEMQAVADGEVIKAHVEVGGDPAKEEDRFERDATKVIDDTAQANTDKLQELAKAADDAESKLNKMYEARKEAWESDKAIPPQMEMAMGEAIAEAEQQLIDAQEALRSFMQDHPELELPLKVDSDGLEEAIQEVTEEAPTAEIPLEFVPKGFVFENKEPVGGGSGNFMARQSLWMPTDGGEGRTKNGSIDLDTNAEEIAARVQAAEDSVGDKSVNINTVADTSGASTAQAAVDSLPSSKTININFKVGKIPGLAQLASGTRNAPGGPTLVNELGPELISEKGRAYIAGGGLPTIVNLSKGAIVLDAEDTKKALDGKKPIVGSIGAAASGGSSTGRVSKANRTSNATLPKSTKSKKKPTYYDSGNNSAKNVEEDKKNKVDWIEVAVDRLTMAIDSLEKVFDSTFRTLDKRMSASNKEIAKIQEGFKTYQDGYERYLKEAESVGLDASIAALVKNGTIDIGKYDDDTKKKIDEFKQW